MQVSGHRALKTATDCVKVYREWIDLMLSGSYGVRPEQAVQMEKILLFLKDTSSEGSPDAGMPGTVQKVRGRVEKSERKWKGRSRRTGLRKEVGRESARARADLDWKAWPPCLEKPERGRRSGGRGGSGSGSDLQVYG